MTTPTTQSAEAPEGAERASRCAECNGPLSDEEIEFPDDRGDGPICCDCECYNHHWTCDFCQECEDDNYTAQVFAVWDEDEANIPVGVYRILSRPFYSQPMIGGGGRILTDRVKRIADLPKNKKEGYFACSMLCATCADPFLTGAALAEAEGDNG